MILYPAEVCLDISVGTKLMDKLTDIAICKTMPLPWLQIGLHTTDSQTNLSLEYGFDSNASDEVEPDDVKSLQHQQQPV